jgi:hypothetical protein
MVPPTICVLCRYLSFIHLVKSAAMAINSLCSTTLGSVTYFIFSLKFYAKSREIIYIFIISNDVQEKKVQLIENK